MYEVHPYAAMVPEMSPEQYEQLRDDIAENGYDPAWPVWLLDGKILDGRHRVKACEALGVEPVVREFQGDSPATFVLRSNNRRDLSPPQRAAMGAELLPAYEDEARRRQAAALDARRDDSGRATRVGPGTHSGDDEPRRAREEVGKLVGVSGASVDRARRIKEQAPEEFEKVKAGERALRTVDNELREKRKAAAEKPAPAPPKVDTDRQRQLAGAAKQRVEKLAGTCQGFSHLPGLKVELAAQVATRQDLADWAGCIDDGIAALRAFRKRIPTNGGIE